MNKIKDNILEFALKHTIIISVIINVIIFLIFNKSIVNYFALDKTNILNMIISVSGTLFGFILTFLSIFIVFRTEEKYQKNDKNSENPLILLINNNSFNDIYDLFIRNSYSLGALLVISIIYYFMTYGLNYYINFIFIVAIFELIVLSIIRVFLSIYTFNTLVRILINSNGK